MTETAIKPRLLTKADAAAYCSLTPQAFDRLRRLGTLPGYVPGTQRFDVRAIDAAIDEVSKLGKLLSPAHEPKPDPLLEYARKRDARKARTN